MNESVLKNLRGALGKQLVVKQYGNKTVVTKYPHMRNVKPSELQKLYRGRFTEAVAYAKDISKDPLLKAAYQHKVKKGESVYHFALKEYLEKNKWK